MNTASTVDTTRLNLLLKVLRLPAINVLWPQFAEQPDKEGWPAARFLAVIAEHKIARGATPRHGRQLHRARSGSTPRDRITRTRWTASIPVPHLARGTQITIAPVARSNVP